MLEHRIRLGGPWEQCLAGQWAKVVLPGAVIAGNKTATSETASTVVRMRRAFHVPSNLEATERVLLEVAEDWGQILKLQLDHQTLVLNATRRYDLTPLLFGFHRLEIHCHPVELSLSVPALVICTAP